MSTTGTIQRASAEYLRRVFITTESGGLWHRHHQGVEPFMPQVVADYRAVSAYVQASRWIVRCPSGSCTGALLAAPAFPRFFCVDCLNADVDNAWLDVAWPSDRDCEAIEAALLARPHFVTRSWNPGQPVSELVFENHFYGSLVDTKVGRVLGDTGHTGPVLAHSRRLSLPAGVA